MNNLEHSLKIMRIIVSAFFIMRNPVNDLSGSAFINAETIMNKKFKIPITARQAPAAGISLHNAKNVSNKSLSILPSSLR